MAKSANMAVSIRSRAATLMFVALLHALLILALLSAVAPVVIMPDERNLSMFDVVEPQPPPPEVEPPQPSPLEAPAGGGGNRRPTPLQEPGNRAIVISEPRPIEIVPLPAFPVPAPPATGAAGPPSSGDGGGVGGGMGLGRGTGSGAGTGTGGGSSVRLARAEWIRKPAPWATYEFWPRNPIGRLIEGRSVLACRVKRSGRPHDCIVVDETPVGKGIGRAGIRLVREGRIKPVTRDGEAVDVRVIIPVTFALHKRSKEDAKKSDTPSVVEVPL